MLPRLGETSPGYEMMIFATLCQPVEEKARNVGTAPLVGEQTCMTRKACVVKELPLP